MIKNSQKSNSLGEISVFTNSSGFHNHSLDTFHNHSHAMLKIMDLSIVLIYVIKRDLQKNQTIWTRFHQLIVRRLLK